jgi:glutamate formiminotransferase
VLDRHADADHHRAVYSLPASRDASQALLAGAREAVARIDLRDARGQHPHVGAIDVVPLVHVSEAQRVEPRAAEALVTAELLSSELRLPVFLYGVLAGGRTRAEIRRGGVANLAARIADEELTPRLRSAPAAPERGRDAGGRSAPAGRVQSRACRPPRGTVARRSSIREVGRDAGCGRSAIELASRDHVAQVSMNVEDPYTTPLAAIVEPGRATPTWRCAEIVGLARAPRSRASRRT